MAMTLQEIENAIATLPAREVNELKEWLANFEANADVAWDEQIASDDAAGHLDFLLAEARAAEDAKTLLPL